MPRIDPLKLLICLRGLLSSTGGIRGPSDVKRLTGLMGKFCKKLVSKCIYIQILKNTDTALLGEFMGAGGWSLSHTWLYDGTQTGNWPLVQEILEMMLLCPVDVQRLKMNSAPKLVKQLSKDGGTEAVRILASKLVEQWLKIVKGESVHEQQLQQQQQQQHNLNSMVRIGSVAEMPQIVAAVPSAFDSGYTHNGTAAYNGHVQPPQPVQQPYDDVQQQHFDVEVAPEDDVEMVEADEYDEDEDRDDDESAAMLPSAYEKRKPAGLVYKFTMKNGKQVLAKVDTTASAGALPSSPGKHFVAPVAATALANSSSLLDIVDEADAATNAADYGFAAHNGDADDPGDAKPAKSSGSAGKPDGGKDRDRAGKSSSSASRSGDKHKSSSSHRKSSSSSSSKRPHGSGSSAHKSSSSSSSSSAHKSGSSSRSSHRDDKDRHRSGSSSKSSSSRDKSRSSGSRSSHSGSSTAAADAAAAAAAAAQAEKSKEILSKVMSSAPSLAKLGKIPKKTPSAVDAAAKKTVPSISIEVRNRDAENRPKTVKLFNSKFRSHGLAEEAPPPPSRRGLKKPSSGPSAPGTVIPATLPAASALLHIGTKRRSVSPPGDGEKRPKHGDLTLDTAGDSKAAIKLTSPKPKPSVLMESDMFMDALSAATTAKKDASRKRKRRTSPSKEAAPTDTTVKQERLSDPAETTASASSSPSRDPAAKSEPTSEPSDEPEPSDKTEDDDSAEPVHVPLKFYQDTLEAPAGGHTSPDAPDESGDAPNSETDPPNSAQLAPNAPETETEAPAVKGPGPGCGPNGPPGVLIVHRRKGPKKTLRWRPTGELLEVRYFEVDEDERCNVYKANSTFGQMKQIERNKERDGFAMARKHTADDQMCEQMAWTFLFEIEGAKLVQTGANSTERAVQQRREQSCLQVMYFNRLMIPDSPAEPDLDVALVPAEEPAIIPLDDMSGNADAVVDFTDAPWPEPCGSPPPPSAMAPMQTAQMQQQLLGAMAAAAAGGVPVHLAMGNGLAPGMQAPGTPAMLHPMLGQQPHGMQPHPYGTAPFGGSPGQTQWSTGNGPMLMDGPPPVFGMNGPPPSHMNGGNFGNGGGHFGPMGGGFNERGGGGGGGWQRRNSFHSNAFGGGNWRGRGGGGDGRRIRSRVCTPFMKGNCRNGPSCNFLHPGVNGPMMPPGGNADGNMGRR